MRELLRLWRASPGGRRGQPVGGTPGQGAGRQRGFSALASSPSPSLVRDGGLKREKVKDTFKEEQQKLYSKMIVGNHEDRSRS